LDHWTNLLLHFFTLETTEKISHQHPNPTGGTGSSPPWTRQRSPRHALEEMNGYRISQLTDVCWFWKKHVKLANSGVVSTLSTSQFLPKKEKKRPPGIDNVPWNRFKLFGSTFLNNLSWGPTFDGMLVSCINLKGLASHPESEDVRITKTKIGRQKM